MFFIPPIWDLWALGRLGVGLGWFGNGMVWVAMH